MSVLRITSVLACAAIVAVTFSSPSFAKEKHGNSWKFNNSHEFSLDTHKNQKGLGHLKHRGKGHHKDHIVKVPEIDAASGMAALAVVLAGMTLVWERRRRRVTV